MKISIVLLKEQKNKPHSSPNLRMYTGYTSEQDCSFVNNAGFNIEITSKSPAPNTIPAQIDTLQEVDIEVGQFSVYEDLFSNEFVPNVNYDIENVPIEDIDVNLPALYTIAFDKIGQRVFTADRNSGSVSIIELANKNTDKWLFHSRRVHRFLGPNISEK